ncbi:MAG TPA: ACP S-malonyltransferase, partial [Cryptosporangiaceae bacterium]|nr:ACP S-malonyltransferase [Cryptosporangiaceae bacterium]
GAACALEPTGMSAVLGGAEEEVLGRLDEYGLTPANRNGAGQIVAAGPLAALQKLADNPPAKARVMPLQVAGAFHTHYMAPAEQALAAIAGGIAPADPTRLLVSNADGAAVTTGSAVVNRLVHQVTAPVRWDLCQSALADLGVTAAIELPPAGTLASLAKRALKGVELVTVNTPDDLAAARDLIARHGGPAGAEPVVQFHVAVATAAGAFTPADVAEGDTLPRGGQVGTIDTRQGTVAVVAVHGGVLDEWLAHHDDPVAPGQPVARLHPAGVER